MNNAKRLVIHTQEINHAGFEQIRGRFPQLEVIRTTSSQELAASLPGAEILCGVPDGESFARARSLHWIHYPGMGVDKLLAVPGLVESNVLLTHTRGVFGPIMAEYGIAAMLFHSRALAQSRAAAAAQRWAHEEVAAQLVEVRGKTLGILGLGEAGGALSLVAKVLGMRVLGIRARPDLPRAGVDEVFGLNGLKQVLEASDFVVVALPLTERTHRLLGATELGWMKRSAVLVNMARGAIVDERALFEALCAGRIRGAVLDVFEDEPLPPSSPLWTLPNVLVTPHIAGDSEHHKERVAQLFIENLDRYLTGRPLLHVLDKDRAY